MEFFKKRSTAWVLFAITVVVCFFIGQGNKPGAGPGSIVEMPSGIYIQDNANILSDATEKHITEYNNGLVSKLGAEIQVITVDTAGGKDMFDLAEAYGDDINLSANSAVFLIAVDDVDAVIVMGNDLYNAPKYIFDDDELSDMLFDNFTVSDFEHRKLDSDVKDAFDDLIGKYEEYYHVDIPAMKNVQKNVTGTSSSSSRFATMVLAYVIFIIIILVIVRMLTHPRRRTVVTNTGYGRNYNNNYPPRGSYTTPPYNSGNSRTGGFSGNRTTGTYTTTTTRTSSSYSSSSRSGGFSSSSRSSSSSRGGSFSSGSRSSSRGGSFSSGSSRSGGSFRK